MAVLALPTLDHGTDRGVQARDVAATGEQSDSHAEVSFIIRGRMPVLRRAGMTRLSAGARDALSRRSRGAP
ncbi:hypothetical protein Cde04nite_05590 [Cellulomonas denverensis]|nr:hypothetical protein Cde04nite_05590 [Cellulomonas denverensis]